MEALLWRKEPETAKAVLTNELACASVVYVDEHVLFWMAGKKARKNFDKVFLSLFIGAHESVTDI